MVFNGQRILTIKYHLKKNILLCERGNTILLTVLSLKQVLACKGWHLYEIKHMRQYETNITPTSEHATFINDKGVDKRVT